MLLRLAWAAQRSEGDGKYYQVEDQRFLGAEEFAQKLKRKVNEEEIFRRKKQLSVVFRSAARAVEVEPQVLGGADRGWEVPQSRALVGYVLIRRLGYKLKMLRSVWVETLQRLVP